MVFNAEKPRITVVAIGAQGAGKSTLLGHLYSPKGASVTHGLDEVYKYALLFNFRKEERSYHCRTVIGLSVSYETDNNYIALIDTPGESGYIKNYLRAISVSEVGLIVVSANKSEHAIIYHLRGKVHAAAALGISQYIVCVSGMDQANFASSVFDHIKNTIERYLQGLNVSKYSIIPVSGQLGDNVHQPSDNMPWWKGETLHSSLNLLQKQPNQTTQPPRFIVHEARIVHGIGIVLKGRVESGSIKCEDVLHFYPSNTSLTIRSIEFFYNSIPEARTGDYVSLAIGRPQAPIWKAIKLGTSDDFLIPPAITFKVKIKLLGGPNKISTGYSPTLCCQTSHIPIRFGTIYYKTDKDGSRSENPPFISANDTVFSEVEIIPSKSDYGLEVFDRNLRSGRFIIREGSEIIAVGIILQTNQVIAGTRTKAAQIK